MASSPAAQGDSSQPYTFTQGVDTATLNSIFSTMSNNPMQQGTGFFSSLLSKVTQTNSQPTSFTTSTTPATTPTSASEPSSTLTSLPASSSSVSAPAATSPAETPVASASSSGTSSSSAANNATASKESSGGMSSGTQAAIAVPIVVVALAVIILAAICIRRRKKRRQETGNASEKVPLAAGKKKWTRHLRIFSFDSELLMGGRFSSTNSIRSRQTGSVRSQAPSQHSQGGSLHSVDEIAPPYRDTVSSVRPLSIGQVIAGTTAAGGVSRSASNATAPPPYGAAAGRIATPTTPPSTHTRQNPFADSPPISPVEGSPFNDPPGATPAISRNSSLYRTDRDDTSTIGGASDVASIREATLARNASVMSGGRIIHDVNNS